MARAANLTGRVQELIARGRRRLRPVGEVAPDAERAHPEYEDLYEQHAAASGLDGVGGGDFDQMGEIQLDVLRRFGLAATSTLLDFGCGNGRLAAHAVRYLESGRYIGTDISPTFLAQARSRVARIGGTCETRFAHQADETFDVAPSSVDVICAFSVFTHMEHEDLFRYLGQFTGLLSDGGLAVISLLPMDIEAGRAIFWQEARITHAERWTRVRNIATSTQFVDQIVDFAGWDVVTWLPGDQPQATSSRGDERSVGQSIVVVRPRAATS